MLDDHLGFMGAFTIDDPVRSSFDSHWGSIASNVGTARALPANIGPFASIGGTTEKDRRDFVALVKARKSPVIVMQTDDILVPEGLVRSATFRGVQMVPSRPVFTEQEHDFRTLGSDDAADMLQLARLTRPGPFAAKTYSLGDFIGIRIDGKLVAMAGQRMAFPGWIEISGVCVHPDYRDRSYARRLVTAMMEKINQLQAMPFLHTYADNVVAIKLYERLGFAVRTEVKIAEIAANI